MRAIDTFYDGHWFRSRLEAKWAVFFGSLGVSYNYELQGYEFDGVRYLPDFYLPEHRCWVEIKPEAPDQTAIKKALMLAAGSSKDVYIFWGDVRLPTEETRARGGGAYRYTPNGDQDNRFVWCECPHCGALGITYEGRAARLPCRCVKARNPLDDHAFNYQSTRLQAAFAAAGMERFESSTPATQTATEGAELQADLVLGLFPRERWEAAKHEIRTLAEKELRTAPTLSSVRYMTYSELCSNIKAVRISLDEGRRDLDFLLGEICVEDRAAGRPLTPALFVLKGENRPAGDASWGFFEQLGIAGYAVATREQQDAAWVQELARLYEYWHHTTEPQQAGRRTLRDRLKQAETPDA